MLPIHKLKITKKERPDGSLLISGKFLHDRHSLIGPTERSIVGRDKEAETALYRQLWWSVYGELNQPLNELMFLARHAAASNPAAYPEDQRIKELIVELNDLLDWTKQLTAGRAKEDKSK